MTSGSDLLNNYGLSQGFTGHEQDDEFGFINMRGRLYDPNLGRFLSADPFVQAPTNTQSYNRYSYVLNNPLSYTDPSGYLFSGLKKFVKENIRTIVAIATVMVAPQLSLMQLMAWNAVTSAALTYGETGSLEAAVTAGLMSGVTTGLSAGLAGAVSNAIPVDGLARTIAHCVAQGTVSVLQGGKFKHGFISGFIGHAAKGLGTRLGFGQVSSEQGLMARTMVSALVGGTVSQLTGGKFANGAMTAAFVHLFNAEANSIQERMNRLAEEISKRGYFKSKGEADWLYQNNANPDLRVSIDASRLTVEVTKGSNWYRDNVLGGWSAWGKVGEGGTFNTDFQIYGTVKVNTATGFIRIMPEEYNFEMKPWNTHFMRNIKTIIASPGLVGTSFWTDFRGVPNVR